MLDVCATVPANLRKLLAERSFLLVAEAALAPTRIPVKAIHMKNTDDSKAVALTDVYGVWAGLKDKVKVD